VTLEDSLSKPVLSKTKPFEFYGKRTDSAMESVQSQFDQSPFAMMDSSRIEQEYDKALVTMNPTEKKIFQGLTRLDAKRRFLYNFWNGRNSNSGDSGNGSYEQLNERMDYANRFYSTITTEGWKTDRGRVYVKYGKPDDVERYPSSSENIPYEIWHYDAIEGGVIFVFADPSSYNNYVLIHSTKQGEVSNTDYEKMLLPGK
jgi:GWxTD domain-containing protein